MWPRPRVPPLLLPALSGTENPQFLEVAHLGLSFCCHRRRCPGPPAAGRCRPRHPVCCPRASQMAAGTPGPKGPLQPVTAGSLLQHGAQPSLPTWGPPALVCCSLTVPTRPSRSQTPPLSVFLLCCCWAETGQQGQIGSPSSAQKKQETETAACARALCRWSNARVPSLTPSSSHASHFHSPFLPPLPPPPSSRVRPILPPFPLLYPFSICQTNSSSTPLSPTSSPLPTPSTPHDPPSRFHTAWRYPSSTIRLNLVNHSHGRSKHHFADCND